MVDNTSKKFKYTIQYSDSYGLFSRPIVTTKFSVPGGGVEIPVFSLIDSGSPVTILHAKIGKILGLDVERGEVGTFSGVGGIPIVGYQHQVALQVVGFPKQIIIKAWFSDIAGTDALLGSVGFFDNFRVVLEQFSNRFEISVRNHNL